MEESLRNAVKRIGRTIHDSPDDHPIYLIAGECNVRYDGKTFVEQEGEKLLIIKPEGTVLVHGRRGIRPENYQLRGSRVQLDTRGEVLHVLARNPRTEEELEVRFKRARVLPPIQLS